MPTLISIFPNSKDLLALAPEDLGGVIMELMPGILQSGIFSIGALTTPLFQPFPPNYPPGEQRQIELALAEALSWLVTQGLLVIDPVQPGRFYLPTRLSKTIRSRTDVEVFRKGRLLPIDLLQPALADKVWPQFLRGDHDVAVFQAFKEVEVTVRKAANAKGAGYPDDLGGVDLMRKAFHPDKGPLRDATAVFAEREAEMHLFSGAMGHARNPVAHRDVIFAPTEAARLIVLASHLLSIVEERM
jgi:uncharacterized protein (TIGR02391 family)